MNRDLDVLTLLLLDPCLTTDEAARINRRPVAHGNGCRVKCRPTRTSEKFAARSNAGQR